MTWDVPEARPQPITAGDAGYEELFPVLWRRAYGVAYQVLGSSAAAEDAAQESLARAYAWWPRITGPPQAWVARVAYTVAVDHGRRQRSARAILLESVTEEQRDPLHAERLDLVAALGRLPKRQREVVLLRYLADQSENDTAVALQLSVSTVRKHSARGLAALRGQLSVGPQEG